MEQARSLAAPDPQLLRFSAELALEQARQLRFLGKQSGYFESIRLARRDAEAGRSLKPHDPRFHLLQSRIETEAREGLLLTPAVAEKPGKKQPQFPAGMKDFYKQQQWIHFQNAEKALRGGLDAVSQSEEDLKDQKPTRMSQRMRDTDPSLNRFQVANLGIELRWSLADTLISEYELAVEGLTDAGRKQESLKSLQNNVNEQMDALKKAGASTGVLDFLKGRLAMAEENWKDAAWTLELTRGRLIGPNGNASSDRSAAR